MASRTFRILMIGAALIGCGFSTPAAASAFSELTFMEGAFSYRPWIGGIGFAYGGDGGLSGGVDIPSGDPYRSGQFNFSAGPAAQVSPNQIGGFDFVFDQGLFTFVEGATTLWEVPVLPFSVSLSAADNQQINSVWEPGALVAGWIMISAGLGIGHLDPQFAAELGVCRGRKRRLARPVPPTH